MEFITGMSTCHEVTVAMQCQMKVFGLSLITNIPKTDTEDSIELSHNEVLEEAEKMRNTCCRLVKAIIETL